MSINTWYNENYSCRVFFALIQNLFVFFIDLFLKNRPLPSFKWIKTSNNTHGYIRATVDFSVGPKPISAFGYHARTLNDKRLIQKKNVFKIK